MTDTRNVPPQIERALQALRNRVRRRFLVHGLGWITAALLGLLAVHYALDRLLVLPAVVRIVLLLALAAYLAVGLRRRLLYPLGRSLELDDMAVLVDRGHPELHQAIVSAVQLDPDHSRGDSPALIAKVQANAADRLLDLPLGDLIRAKRTLRVWGIAGCFGLLLAIPALLAPAGFGIWMKRLFGTDTPYPRATFLRIEVPSGQGNYRVTDSGEAGSPILVDLARGADLPVNVDVVDNSRVPQLVELHVTAEPAGTIRKQPMSRRGTTHFRHVFRRLLQPMRLFGAGGDDPGTREVRVRILTPPSVTGLAVRVDPPAYTRRPTQERSGGLVEALPGSKVTISFQSTAELEQGALHFQETGRKLAAVIEEGTQPPTYAARFTMPDKADRYRIHLVAKNGLKQLSPGLHSVIPHPDRKPKLRLLSPSSSLQALTTHAAFPLRVVATDDYGLAKIELAVKIGAEGEPTTTVLWEGTAAETAGNDGSDYPKQQTFLELYSPAQLMKNADRKPREGDRFTLSVVATDIRLPEAQQGAPQIARIDLLDVEELRRRLQSRLRTTRRRVERALKIQLEQEARIETFLAEVGEGNGASDSRRRLGLTTAEAGQQRVRGFLLQIRGDLGEVLDAHLFNGLDASPAIKDVIEAYLSYYRAHPLEATNDPGFWVATDQLRKDGSIGKLELLGRLDDMFMISHRILEDHLVRSLRSLAAASTADQDDKFQASMLGAQKAQASIVSGLNDLLRLLEDWNDYQDVVRMTRRLRDAERDLLERIKQRR